MTGINKAAIAWTIAIVAFGAGMAVTGDATQNQDAKTVDELVQVEVAEEVVLEDEVAEESAEETPKTVNVVIQEGTSVRGCERTDECYTPMFVSINAGDTVRWNNTDTSAHTITSGTITSGPDGMFESSLLRAGDYYGVVFLVAGSYDYYCLIHTWMVGNVEVA